jgi:hypothetical protein
MNVPSSKISISFDEALDHEDVCNLVELEGAYDSTRPTPGISDVQDDGWSSDSDAPSTSDSDSSDDDDSVSDMDVEKI